MKKSSSVVSLRRMQGKLVAAVQLLLFLVSAPVLASALIPQVDWTLKSADSEETIDVDGAATNAFDGDVSTFWHTQLQGSSPRPPHWIDIDLGAVHDVDGFRYLPRQDGGVDGRVEIFVFYVSMDGVTWGSAVAAGTLRNHAQEQEVSFALTQGRYVRFKALTEENGQPWTSVAELNVLGTGSSGMNIEPNGVIDTPGDDATVEVGGTLDFTGSGSDPDSGASLSYRWTFGDPTVADQTVEDPHNVMFNTPGTHTVALTAVDHLGLADSTPATMQVTVNVPSATGVIPQTGGSLFPVKLQGSAPEAVFGITTTGLNLLSVPSLAGIQFHKDFENEVLHVYTRQDLKDHWNGAVTSSIDSGNVEIVKDPVASGRGNVMRVFYPAGKYGQGPRWKTPVGKHEELYLAYDVMFDENFEWVYGGKIPGLAGGPKDHSGGNIPDGTTGWMGRLMWRDEGMPVTYMFTYDWGYTNPVHTGARDVLWDHGPDGQKYFTRGKWHTVELYYKMNTPGQRDGTHKAWFDGELAVDAKIAYRTTDTVKVDTFVMSTFYGGNGPEWTPKEDQHMYFDNFIVSTMPITHHDEPIDSHDAVRN